jgi:disulfide bond formation protein DsbB
VNGGTTNRSLAKRAPWSLAGLFGLGMVGLIAGRKRLHRSLSLICLALMLSGAFLGLASCTNSGYSTPPPAPKVTTPNGSYNVQVITYSQETLQQSSLTAPVFNLPVTVN